MENEGKNNLNKNTLTEEKVRGKAQIFFVFVTCLYCFCIFINPFSIIWVVLFSVLIYNIHLKSKKVGLLFLLLCIPLVNFFGFFYGFFVPRGEIDDLEQQNKYLNIAIAIYVILLALGILAGIAQLRNPYYY